jgi:hypothetical protein
MDCSIPASALDLRSRAHDPPVSSSHFSEKFVLRKGGNACEAKTSKLGIKVKARRRRTL